MIIASHDKDLSGKAALLRHVTHGDILRGLYAPHRTRGRVASKS